MLGKSCGHLVMVEEVFQVTMLKNFARGLRGWLSAIESEKNIPRSGACAPRMNFGIALVQDNEVKSLICDEKTPEEVKGFFLEMMELRLSGRLPPEQNCLAYECRKYEIIVTLEGDIAIIKLPKALRGIAIGDDVYRVFMLVDTLVGRHYGSLKAMAGPFIDERLREAQKLLTKQANGSPWCSEAP